MTPRGRLVFLAESSTVIFCQAPLSSRFNNNGGCPALEYFRLEWPAWKVTTSAVVIAL